MSVLARDQTVLLWACLVEQSYNFDSDEILWVLYSQALMQSFL